MSKIDTVEYFIGDELDPLALWWYRSDSPSTLVDLSVTHTYSSTLYLASDSTHTNVFSAAKTSGFTGAAGAGTKPNGTPNLTVTWATSGELNTPTTSGLYIFQIVATRSSDSKQRTAEIHIQMKAR
jgi:hypothetical protein